MPISSAFRSRLLTHAAWLAPAFSIAAGCGASVDPIDVGAVTQAVQTGFGFALGRGFDLVSEQVPSNHARVSAAIRVVTPTANWTCGATFVSRHYAVTAAHCTDGVELGQPLALEQISARFPPEADLREYLKDSMTIVGTWPDWKQAATLSEADGYFVAPLDCKIVRRCRFGGQNEWGEPTDNCPMEPRYDPDKEVELVPEIDLALIECPDRTDPLGAIVSAEPQQPGMPVQMWWFHEVYDLPIVPDGSERWEHYGKYDGSDKYSNYHYARADHQLLPLRTASRPDAKREVVRSVGGSTAATLPSCHGSSGAGVFAEGDLPILFGPLQSGADTGTLCLDMNDPATQSFHVASTATAEFVRNSPEIAADR